MANRHYLTLVDQKVICPGYRNDTSLQTQCIEEAGWFLPFLWFAMFRESDLIEESIPDDYGPTPTFAPVTSVESAMGNLASAYEMMANEMTVDSNLKGYFELTQEDLCRVPLPYVTFQWFESSEVGLLDFDREQWRLILRGFERPGVISAKSPSFFGRLFWGTATPWVKAVRHYATFDPRTSPLPPARAHLDDLDLTKEELQLHAWLYPEGGD